MATFTNDWNFFVPEVRRGNGTEERSLEIGGVARGRKEMMETGSRFTQASIVSRYSQQVHKTKRGRIG